MHTDICLHRCMCTMNVFIPVKVKRDNRGRGFVVEHDYGLPSEC